VPPDPRRDPWVEVGRGRPAEALDPLGTDPGEREDAATGGPMDTDLEALDAELVRAGERARAAYRGRTEPTRYFAAGLRARLVSAFEASSRQADRVDGQGTPISSR
jgi:hypothetical protein